MISQEIGDKILERILARALEVDHGFESFCWEFQGAKDDDGYGKVKVNGAVDRVHRVVYVCSNGALADGHVVRHRCDNPPCCRPDHLLAGSQKDNMQDMVERGRHRGTHKLDTKQVEEIRAARLRDTPVRTLARRYGVSEATITMAVGGHNWHDSLDFVEV